MEPGNRSTFMPVFLMLILPPFVFSAVLTAKWLWSLRQKAEQGRAVKAKPEKSEPTLETCDSAKAPSTERLCPLPRISSLSSPSTSSSSPVDTLCSFPEPCPSAMAELAAQKCWGPAQSPKDDQGLVENLGAALGQDPPLEQSAGTRQEQVPGDEGEKAQTPRDVEPAPGSRHARLRTLGIEIWLQSNGAELPVPHMDTDRAEDGDTETRTPNMEPLEIDTSSPVKLGSSSPVSLGSTIPAAPGRSSPAEPSPQQQVPAGRTRGWAWEGCAQLCRCTKAWWQRCCQSCCRRFCKPPEATPTGTPETAGPGSELPWALSPLSGPASVSTTTGTFAWP